MFLFPNFQPNNFDSNLLKSGTSVNQQLDVLSKKSFDFFWEESNPVTGFTLDRAPNFTKENKNFVASSASIGFAFCAYAIGVKNKWITRDQGIERTTITLENLYSNWEQDHGWFYHFCDWRTGKRQWNCEVSSIDTSILLAGIMVADDYYRNPKIHNLSKRIEDRIDWKWMLTDGGNRPEEKFFCMGWTPEHGWIKARWDGYDELMMLYIQAYYFYPTMPNGSWHNVTRNKVQDRGFTFIEGGPLFMHEMSQSFFSVKNMRDDLGIDYWLNSRNCALANRAYCADNPKHFVGYSKDYWGLSASDAPDGYEANGTPLTTSDDGTITPSSAIGVIQFVPEESKEFLADLSGYQPNALGIFGYSNGLNPTRDWIGPDVIGIDLGMQMLGIDAYRNGFITGITSKDKMVQEALRRMSFHKVVSNLDSPVFLTIGESN